MKVAAIVCIVAAVWTFVGMLVGLIVGPRLKQARETQTMAVDVAAGTVMIKGEQVAVERSMRYLVDRDFLVRVDSYASLAVHRGIDDETRRELDRLSGEARRMYSR